MSEVASLDALLSGLPTEVGDRTAFIELIPRTAEILEIGPFHSPLTRGERVHYFDVLDHAGLVGRAKAQGRSTAQIAQIPPVIHYVSPAADLSVVDRTFDVILSSHVIEHQPDLITHFYAVSRLLRPGGLYFVLVPDRRYCFDHFIRPSTIADVLDAHYTQRKVHTLKSQIEHFALTTHNSSRRHWEGDHTHPRLNIAEIQEIILQYKAHPDRYVDVHAWQFEPTTFFDLFGLLVDLDHTDLEIGRIYPTHIGSNEFWAVLARREPGKRRVVARPLSVVASVASHPAPLRAPAPPHTPEEPVVVSPSLADPPLERARRRFHKLKNDPARFFSDSRYAFGRRFARLFPRR